MKELSLHLLDIAQNSVTAGAKALDLTVTEADDLLSVTVADDGRGMSPELLAAVTDPFTTTRTTRKVGLGLPLLKLATELTGGSLRVDSTLGQGTTVTAVFRADSIDCPPLGAMAETVALLVQGAPEDMELTYTRTTPKGTFRFDTREVREILGPEILLSTPEVAQFVREYTAEGEESVALEPVSHLDGTR